jgi:hypothetical protein
MRDVTATRNRMEVRADEPRGLSRRLDRDGIVLTVK